jgi:2-oxoglutarate dehydrogenase E2 component (dihydrolipoamide succinyltransferase)
MGLRSTTSSARLTKGDEERVKMTRLRSTIAKRLKEAQNNAAMLTTFNEIDMSRIIEMRAEYKEGFHKRYGVKLGFMSFFVRSCVEALKAFPIINAEIQQDEIVYKNYYNIGVAVGTEKGLVVPVVRDADELSFADIERQIIALGEKAKTGQLSIEELQGGTFTITNGGIYGSMLSTPILNPPQSGVLGMHNIVQRAVVVDGKVEVRPIMYLALSYDHRIIDGKDAVSFLVRVKEYLEDPRRLFLNL